MVCARERTDFRTNRSYHIYKIPVSIPELDAGASFSFPGGLEVSVGLECHAGVDFKTDVPAFLVHPEELPWK